MEPLSIHDSALMVIESFKTKQTPWTPASRQAFLDALENLSIVSFAIHREPCPPPRKRMVYVPAEASINGEGYFIYPYGAFTAEDMPPSRMHIPGHRLPFFG